MKISCLKKNGEIYMKALNVCMDKDLSVLVVVYGDWGNPRQQSNIKFDAGDESYFLYRD